MPGRVLQNEEFLKLKKASLSDLENIIKLRHKVLHPGGPLERVLYEEDRDSSTLHLILKNSAGQIEACGTLIDEGSGVFRIRGMAVSKKLRGQGVGASIVECFISYVKENEKAKLIRCNGRLAALSLYERAGFQKTGSVFEVPGSGPHYKLVLDV